MEAFRGLPDRLAVVGTGPAGARLRATRAAERHLRRRGRRGRGCVDLYRSARALVFPADEDFGIAMAEAQACGTPVIALGKGGALDIVAHGETGWLLSTQELGELRAAVKRAAVEDLDRGRISSSAQRFSAARFRRELREAVAGAVPSVTARAA